MNVILISTIILAILGLFIGIFLGVFSKLFKVVVDEKILKIRECLPGNNCGGCGYAGCDALAEAIAKGEAKSNACTVGGEEVMHKISDILGVKADAFVKKVAFVHCNGDCNNTENIYNYLGPRKCSIVSKMANQGEKACSFACIGYGDCVNVCQFDAIHIINSVSVVNPEKCTACSECIKACPLKIIDFIPYGSSSKVQCSNKNKGKQVTEVCKVSCIGCGICEKNCPANAIKIIDNLSVIDYDKCTNCNTCKEKCPRKCIV